MAQSGYTPIQLYYSTTAAAVPVNTNLASGELALNIQDEKLYFKNAAGTVKLLASNATSAPVTSFQTSLSGLTPSTATTGAVTLAGTLGTANGGTGLTSFTSGGLVYASSTSALTTSSTLLLTGTILNVVGTNSAVNVDGGGVGGIGNTFGVVGTSYGYVGTSTATPLVFNTGNTERVRITSAGDVGIGTSAPSAKLTVINAGDANKQIVFSDNATYYGSVGHNSGTGLNEYRTEPSGGHGFFIGTSGTANMTLNSSGNLGIGTSSPAYKLDLLTSANFAGRWANATRAGHLYLDSGGPGIFNTAAYGGEGIYFHAGSNYTAFLTNSAERMRLDSAGNVCIGTSSPSAKLHVSTTSSNVSIVQSSNANGGYQEFNNGSTAPLYVGFGPTLVTGISASDAALRYATFLAFSSGATEKARLSNAGGFSVGTTADPGAGAIYATGNITAYYSDKRLKTVSGKIENALDKVAQLSGVYYTNNSVAKSFGYDSDEVQVGVLAQDVEAVLPQIVKAAPFDLDADGNSKSGENYKTVQYERLVPLLIEAINELQAKVKLLENK